MTTFDIGLNIVTKSWPVIFLSDQFLKLLDFKIIGQQIV